MGLPLKPAQNRRCPGLLPKLFERQSGESDPRGMHLVSNVQSNEQGSHGFDDARVFEFPSIQWPGAWNLCGELARDLFCIFVIAADKDVAIDWSILAEQFRAHIVKGCGNGYGRGDQIAGLLGSRTLPHAK